MKGSNIKKSLADLGNEKRGLTYRPKPLTPRQEKAKKKLKSRAYA